MDSSGVFVGNKEQKMIGGPSVVVMKGHRWQKSRGKGFENTHTHTRTFSFSHIYREREIEIERETGQ